MGTLGPEMSQPQEQPPCSSLTLCVLLPLDPQGVPAGLENSLALKGDNLLQISVLPLWTLQVISILSEPSFLVCKLGMSLTP